MVNRDLIAALRTAVGNDRVLTGAAFTPYSRDATFMVAPATAAVLPASTEEVAAVVRVCAEAGSPIVARGSGTGLAGGPVPVGGGVVLSLERLQDLDIDTANSCAVAGAGVITGELQTAAAQHGLFYPPDPASVALSTIGGNVACNAGGMSCLKYGVTSDYVIGMTVVLADGSVLRLGGKLRKRASGYRLAQLFVGSEGTLGIVTELVLKLIPLPRHRATAMIGYDSLDHATQAVARVLGSGHLPVALELIDRSALDLVAEYLPPGFEPTLEAVLLVEQDGNDADHVQAELEQIAELLQGARVQVARTEAERSALWTARRHFGRLFKERPTSFLAEDIGVPIAMIPEMVRRIRTVARETGLKIIVFGHAGDGNLHPTFHFDPGDRSKIGPAYTRILRDAIELGGTVSAEHGLGALKRDFAEAEHGSLAIALMRTLKDALDPAGILNPHKVFPEGPADDMVLARQPGWES